MFTSKTAILIVLICTIKNFPPLSLNISLIFNSKSLLNSMATPRDLVLLEQKYEVKPHSAVMYLSSFGSKWVSCKKKESIFVANNGIHLFFFAHFLIRDSLPRQLSSYASLNYTDMSISWHSKAAHRWTTTIRTGVHGVSMTSFPFSVIHDK